MANQTLFRYFKFAIFFLVVTATIGHLGNAIYLGRATFCAYVLDALAQAVTLGDIIIHCPEMFWEAAIDAEFTVRAFEKLASNFGDKRYTRIMCIGLRVVIVSWVLGMILSFIKFVRLFVKKSQKVYSWVEVIFAILYRPARRFVGWIVA